MYKFILAFRYMFRKRISYLALLAVSLCVFIVVVVMTVMTGLVDDFKRKNHEFVGDCVVATESLVGFGQYEDFVKILEGCDFVQAVSAVIRSYGLVSPGGSGQCVGVEIMGIDPVRHSQVTGFGKMLHYRSGQVSKAFEPVYDPNLPGCIAAVDLKLPRDARGGYVYGAGPDREGLAVSCFPLTAKGALARAGAGEVNTKTFYCSDYARSGLARIDDSLIYLPFEQAQMLCGMGQQPKRVSMLLVKFRQGVKPENGSRKVSRLWADYAAQIKAEKKSVPQLENVTVQNWKQYRRAYIAAMEKEQTMMIVMFALVAVTTVFIVFVVFYMIISHKSKDIGILKSIGVSNVDLIGLFSCFAFIMASVSCCVGVFLGWLFLVKINGIEDWLFEHFRFQLWDRSIYAIDAIPNTVDFKVLSGIVLSGICVCLAGALAASRRAMKARPVDSLQVSQL